MFTKRMRVLFWLPWLLLGQVQADEYTLTWGSAYDLQPHPVVDPQSQAQLLLGFLSFDPLFRYNAEGRLSSRLVSSWSIVSDTHFRFRLRPDIHFHSGNRLTTKDIIWTYQQLQRYLADDASYLAVKSVVPIDELSFDVITHRPFPELFHRLSYFFPADSQWAQSAGSNNNLVVSGTGPYIFKRYQQGVQWEFKANPLYWGEVKGNVEQIRFIPIQQVKSRMAGLFAHDLDVIDHLLAEQVNHISKNKQLAIIPSNGIDWLALQINMTNPALANPMVREALNLAVNNDMLAESLGPLASAASQFSVEGLPGHNPELRIRYNSLLAHQLLHQAGYQKGLVLKLVVEKDLAQQQDVVALLLSMLERVNIGVQVEALDSAAYQQALSRCEGDIVVVAKHSYDQNILGVMRSMLRPWERQHEACSYYQGDAAYALLSAAEHELDITKRYQLIQQLEQQMYQDAAFVPLFWQKRIWGINQQRLGKQGWNPYAAFPYFEQLRLLD